MANNLIALVMQFLTPDMIAKIASAVGLDRSLAQKAIAGAIPSLLAGLTHVASTSGGARQLSNAAAQQPPVTFDTLKNLAGGSGQRAFADSGSSMLSGLLGGDTLNALTQSIGKFAGIGDDTSKSLLGMLGPVVMGALGQHQRVTGLDAGGLASLLSSQKDQIASAIPSGLADQLSATGLLDRLGDDLRGSAAAASAAAGRFGSAAERTAYAATNPAVQAARSTASSNWPLWALGLVALGAAAWYLLSQFGPGTEQVVQVPQSAAVKPVSETVGAAPSNLTVGGVNLRNRIDSSVDTLKSTLNGITDAASAQAALPKLRETTTQFDEVNTLSLKLSPENRSVLAKMITAAMPTINQLCDKVLSVPGVDDIAKPAIDELRGKLDALAKA